MTQDEIIEMAREAGFEIESGMFDAKIVCVEGVSITRDLEAFAKLVAQHEREECLKFCDQVAEYFPSSGFVGSYIGQKIRARGQA